MMDAKTAPFEVKGGAERKYRRIRTGVFQTIVLDKLSQILPPLPFVQQLSYCRPKNALQASRIYFSRFFEAMDQQMQNRISPVDAGGPIVRTESARPSNFIENGHQLSDHDEGVGNTENVDYCQFRRCDSLVELHP